MTMMHHNDSRIPMKSPAGHAPIDCLFVELWFVRGLSDAWPTKVLASAAARAWFPTAYAEYGDGLLSFRRFYSEESLSC